MHSPSLSNSLSVSDDYYRSMGWLSAARTGYFRNPALFPAHALAALIGPRRHGMFTCLSTRSDCPIEHIHYSSDDPRGCMTATADALLVKLPPMLTGLHLGPRASGEKELVIDIDLRDHPLRGVLCDCSRDSVCADCWLLIDLAVVVCEALLVPSFGQPLVVFSGGKGAHIWFGNAQARVLSVCARKSLADMFLRGPPDWTQPVMALLEQRLLSFFSTHVSRRVTERAAFQTWRSTLPTLGQAVRQLAWPVVDTNVLASWAHTVKCPFSIHDKTFRLALPIDRSKSFDPATSPRVPVTADDHDTIKQAVNLFLTWLRENSYISAH